MDFSSRSAPDDGDPTAAPTTPRYEEVAGSSNSWPSTPATAEHGQTEAHVAAQAAARREKGRVRFNSNAALTAKPAALQLSAVVPERPALSPVAKSPGLMKQPVRPSALRAGSSGTVPTLDSFKKAHDPHDPHDTEEKSNSAAAAQERAKQVAEKLQRGSPTASRNSVESHDFAISDGESLHSDIPLQNLTIHGDASHSQMDVSQDADEVYLRDVAHDLVRSHTRRYVETPEEPKEEDNGEGSSNHAMPSDINGGLYDGVYAVPAPEEYRGGVLSQLLKLYKSTDQTGSPHTRNSSHGYHPLAAFGHRRARSTSSTGPVTPGSDSGRATPSRKKWYEHNRSQDTLANLIEASARLANPKMGHEEPADTNDKGEKKDKKDKKDKKKRPSSKRTNSASRLSSYWQKEEARITVHIAETLARQGYIIKLCRALMLYGAPTHRLEEYLSMTARVLEIEGQFLYLPGCMVVSFDDQSTHTTEVRIVRVIQGIDLGKLKDVHHIYKEVMHDVIHVEAATERLETLMSAKEKFNSWLRVLIFGLTSVTAAPFSFKARLIDLPLIFCLGCLVGFLQIIVAPLSSLYSNVLEVVATVIISFLARAFGSIHYPNSENTIFCFSALAQSGIVMLLPGYAVLCSALELQSRAIVPGSIRIVYAIVYSLLIGFGITVGSALWAIFDQGATSDVTCKNPMSDTYYPFIFVPFFIICISILYQAKWKQMPVMIVIAFTGYIVNYFSGQRFKASPQIANTLGALAVGVLANLYSRIRHGVAAATLIPAIFVQVPGGLASTGGLLSGVQTANALVNKTGTDTGSTSQFNGGQLNTAIFDVAASMIQIAIGIAVGLFISALVVYPLGKRRSGLFSF